MRFTGYSDPERCKEILNEYEMDLNNYGLKQEVETILEECSDSVQLEIRLDTLITHTHQKHAAISSGRIPLDEDSGRYE